MPIRCTRLAAAASLLTLHGSSAYLYMGGLDPALGVTLQSDIGYTYAVSAVPEPAAAWLLLIGLPALAWRARRPDRGARD